MFVVKVDVGVRRRTLLARDHVVGSRPYLSVWPVDFNTEFSHFVRRVSVAGIETKDVVVTRFRVDFFKGFFEGVAVDYRHSARQFREES